MAGAAIRYAIEPGPMKKGAPRSPDDGLEPLVARAAAGDERAWQDLWRLIQPKLLKIIAQASFLGPLGQREDDRPGQGQNRLAKAPLLRNPRNRSSGGIERLPEIGEDVLFVLDADRQPDVIFVDPGLQLLFRRELRVGRRRRMDCQTARVANIGDMVKHLQRVDKAAPGLGSALQFETDQSAIAALEIGVGTPFGFAGHHARVDDAGHLGMLGEELGDSHRIGAVPSCRDHPDR